MSIENVNEIGKLTKYFEFNKDEIGQSLATLLSAMNKQYIYQKAKFIEDGNEYYVDILVPENDLEDVYYKLPYDSILLDISINNVLKENINFYAWPNTVMKSLNNYRNIAYLNFNCLDENVVSKNLKYYICYLIDYKMQNKISELNGKDLETMQNYYLLNVFPEVDEKIRHHHQQKKLIRKFKPTHKLSSRKYSNDKLYKTIKGL